MINRIARQDRKNWNDFVYEIPQCQPSVFVILPISLKKKKKDSNPTFNSYS